MHQAKAEYIFELTNGGGVICLRYLSENEVGFHSKEKGFKTHKVVCCALSLITKCSMY